MDPPANLFYAENKFLKKWILKSLKIFKTQLFENGVLIEWILVNKFFN